MVFVVLGVLLLVTGFLTMAEMGLFSVRRERLELAANAGDGRARIALHYLDDPPKFLTASNVLLTLLSVVVGSLVQPSLTDPFVTMFTELGLRRNLVQPAAYASAVTVLTIVSLIFANLLPKQLGFVWAETVTLFCARLMQVYVALAQPLAWVVEPLVRLFARLLRVPIGAQPMVAEGDLLLLMEEGLKCGGVDRREQAIAKRAFGLSDMRIEACMTPRDLVEWIEVDLTPSVMNQRIARSKRSWLVVADDSLDNVLGVVQARRYLALSSPPNKAELMAMLMRPLIVKSGTRLTSALDRLAEAECRVMLVEDERGRLEGLVTANDIVAAIVGPLKALR